MEWAAFNQISKLPPMELNSWAGTWLTPKPSQSKLEWKSLWNQRCGDLNHVRSQLLSQPSISLLLKFLPAALVSVSSDLLLQRILLQRLLSPQSGLFSLEALKEGLQGNSGFPRRSDIFFKNWVIPSESSNCLVLSKHTISQALTSPLWWQKSICQIPYRFLSFLLYSLLWIWRNKWMLKHLRKPLYSNYFFFF